MKTAVLLFDMQDFFLRSFPDAKNLIPVQKKVLQYCVRYDLPVLKLELAGYGTTVSQLQNEINQVPRNVPLVRPYSNGFSETNLDQMLKKIGTEELFLMGINASACIKSTAHSALDYDYKISTAADVIADSKGTEFMNWYSKNGRFFKNYEGWFKSLNY